MLKCIKVINMFKLRGKVDNSKFVIVSWPDVQELMDEDGFEDNSCLINDDKFYEIYGDSAYFVNEDWLKYVDAKNESEQASIED